MIVATADRRERDRRDTGRDHLHNLPVTPELLRRLDDEALHAPGTSAHPGLNGSTSGSPSPANVALSTPPTWASW